MNLGFTGIRKVAELAANIALIVLCLVLSASLFQRYLGSHSRCAASGKQATAGFWRCILQNEFPGDDGPFLILALRSDCPFCKANVPLYSQILAVWHKKRYPAIAVFPAHDGKAEEFVEGYNLQVQATRKIDFHEAGLDRVPTVLILGPNGVIRNAWIGHQAKEKCEAIAGRIRAF